MRPRDRPAAGRRGAGCCSCCPGAPRRRVVEAALWAAFARHSAAAGRLVVAGDRGRRPRRRDLAAGAARLRVGDPRDPATEIGPLDSEDALAAVEAAVAGADARGGGRAEGLERPVLAAHGGGRRRARRRRCSLAPPPGPVLAVHEAASVERAIAVAAGAASVSVWARDRDQGERVARRLAAPLTWVGPPRRGAARRARPARPPHRAAPARVAHELGAGRAAARRRPAHRRLAHRAGRAAPRPRVAPLGRAAHAVRTARD